MPYEQRPRAIEDVRDYIHRMRNMLNAPIMRAALLCELTRELRSRCMETRLRAQEVRAGVGRTLAAPPTGPRYPHAA